MSAQKVLIIGAHGVIGTILTEQLGRSYEIIGADTPLQVKTTGTGLAIDVCNFDQVLQAASDNYDAVINLVGLGVPLSIVSPDVFQDMMNTYIAGTYNILEAARINKIPKVILASSNRATGAYENDGVSSFGRPIRVSDYPAPGDLYGAMKLFGEQAGRLFSNPSLSVICLRLGTVHAQEDAGLERYKRLLRTVLSHKDMINLFKCALDADVEYGVYYGVSDNPGCPWSIEEAKKDLGYVPMVNSTDLLRKVSKVD